VRYNTRLYSISGPRQWARTRLTAAYAPAGIRLNPVVQPYAWPSELDLMARIAGVRLKNRWGGWEREPFNSSSSAHVSVYAR
jgi:hypothetical protein